MMKTVYLGAGCFWGVQSYFDDLTGVTSTEAGYAGGNTKNPTYKEVCSGTSGHIEVIQVKFDSSVISLDEVLKEFFRMHNPTQTNGQGPDIGEQYLSRIFITDNGDKETSESAIKKAQTMFKLPIITKVLPVKNYFPAEDYHQKYNVKNGYTCHVNLNY